MAYSTDDKLTEDQRTRFAAIVSRELLDAREYQVALAEDRAESTRYYNGEPMGDEEEGRSQVVSRDVLETVVALMPSAMRIFFGSERIVELKPRGAEDVDLAAQQSAYINDVVIEQDNPGFIEVHSGVKDAFVRKLGIFKWWWDDRTRVVTSEHTGLTEEALALLAEDKDVQEIQVKQTSEEGVLPRLFSATVRREVTDGRARFAAVPGNEFLVDRRAKLDPDTWTFAAHRQELTLADLEAMGYDRDEIREHGTPASSSLGDDAETLARNPHQVTLGTDTAANEDMRRVAYTESFTYTRWTQDDDVQLIKFCGLGDGANYHLLHAEPVPEMPFAAMCPDPEPHTLFGSCPADIVKDIQRIKTALLRGTLDSMALSIHPRYEAVATAVNLQDLMNSEVGGIVRVDAPGMLREMQLPFVGSATLPILQYVDEMRQDRTKQSKASEGLDADALQSTTKAAVTATITAAQAQLELYARIFAETGFKRLFRGLYRLVVRHQDAARTVRLRNGQYVSVDPRSWDADMDVMVNVALGSGAKDEKMAVLMGIAAKQEAVLMAAPGNPMVSMRELRATYAAMAELGGYKDTTRFFKEVPEGYQPPQPAGGEGDAAAAQALMQVQMAEIQAKQQQEAAKLAFEREKLAMEDARERYKAELDARVKILIANENNATKIEVEKIDAMIEKARMQQDAATRTAEARISAQASVDREHAKPKPAQKGKE